MITLKSKFKEAYDVCVSLEACEPALDWMRALLKKNPEISVGESLDLINSDEKADETWAVWNLFHAKGNLDEDVQNGFIRKIKTPMFALQVLLKCEFLTAEQDAVLEKIYKGKLPTAEKELRTGVITTAKSRLNQWQ